MNVIFMGTPDYAQSILQSLIDDADIKVVTVYTQPDKPVGRKKVMTPPPVKVLAQQHGIDVLQPERLRDEATVTALLQIACDFIVVAAYGQILPKAVLEHAPCINLHASILPRYRGASPIQQALLEGDNETGVTAMLMDEGLDTGAILQIETIMIQDDEMVESLFERLTDVAARMTPEVLKNFAHLIPQAQDDAQATHCKKITKADGLVQFDDAKTLYNRYRAFTPWPGVYLENGLKLKNMVLESLQPYETGGTIIAIDKESAVVTTKRGALRLYAVQPPSKKEMRITDYLNGARLGLDDTLA